MLAANTAQNPIISGPDIWRYCSDGAVIAATVRPDTSAPVYIAARVTTGPPRCIRGPNIVPSNPYSPEYRFVMSQIFLYVHFMIAIFNFINLEFDH